MEDAEDIPIVEVKTSVGREGHQSSSDSDLSAPDLRRSKQKITVEYEAVGSFEVFETICPLEYFGGSNMTSSDNSLHHRKTKRKSVRERNSKKNIKTISIAQELATESSEDLIAAYDPQFLMEPEKPAPISIPITLDAFFRSENPRFKEPIEGEATLYWARGDGANISGGGRPHQHHHHYHHHRHPHKGHETDSDLDPDIEVYIRSQQEKKNQGLNVTGESLWYDQERSIIRNLHTDGSISLTSYGDTDEKIFGKTEIFDAILTCEERAMLRARNADTTYTKVEKKKKVEVRKGRKIRPKDQGDWL